MDLLTPAVALAATATPASGHSSERLVAVFLAEIAVMLVVGRLSGEVMQRLRQPAVMGQILAGVLLGPSVLGGLWPHGFQRLFLRRRDISAAAAAVVGNIERLGEREGVHVEPVTEVRRDHDVAILEAIERGRHDLVVLGVNRRPGEALFFGETADALLDDARCSLLLVNS